MYLLSILQVHDVGNFIADHPGGERILAVAVGTDASRNFHGQVYKHSNAAKNLLSNLRVARLIDESPAEIDSSEVGEPPSKTSE